MKLMRRAIVTGGSRGIGAAIVGKLLSQDVEVVFVYDKLPYFELTTSLEMQGIGDLERVRYLDVDLLDADAVDTTTREVLRDGYVDILVNNAGIYPRGNCLTTSISEFQDVMRINCEAAFQLTKLVAPGMVSARRGRIVNIASIVAYGGWSEFCAYATSKSALIGLTRATARELGTYEITVNAVAPGAIPTAAENISEETDRFVLERQCVPFRGNTNDVASAVAFLLSDETRFLTGQVIHVNGGWYMG